MATVTSSDRGPVAWHHAEIVPHPLTTLHATPFTATLLGSQTPLLLTRLPPTVVVIPGESVAHAWSKNACMTGCQQPA